jgi:hypothetical protein
MFSAPRDGIGRRPALAAGAGALALLAAVGIYAVATRSADTPTASPQPVAEAPDGPAANPDTASSNLARSDTVPLMREGADATDPVADAANSHEPVASGADLPSTRATAVPAVGDGQTSPEASAESPSQDTADSSGTGAVPSGPAPGGAGPDAPSKLPLRGIPEVLDTATLWLSGQIVHLYGVEWVRGSGDPDDFTRYLKGREVACDPVENVDAYRCTVDGHDLSEVVLFNGGAKSAPNAPPELRAAEEKARVAKTGVWSR